MASITYSDFSGGLDLRKSASVSDPNRLRELKNAYITDGKAIRKRPGLSLVADFAVEDVITGTKGLVSGLGVLNTFYPYTASPPVHSNTEFKANLLEHTTGAPYGQPLAKVHQGDVFANVLPAATPPEQPPYVYVAVEYQDGEVFHYYIDGTSPNLVTDSTKPYTPKSKVFSKQESRIFVPDDNVLQFCALSNCRDWSDTTTDTGASYVNVGVKSRGSDQAIGIGQYDGNMAVFFSDGMQTWAIDEAYTSNQFLKYVPGVGTNWPKTPIAFAGDLLFLSKSGFRSITTQSYTTNLQDSDVGSPIDSLVRAEVGDATDPLAEYFSGMNQYWCSYALASGNTRVWVYTYSRSDKISAWSKYEYGMPFDALTSHKGYLYVRSGEKVFRVDETDSVFDDNGQTYEMRVDFPFLNFKTPGVLKHIKAIDLVVDGTVDVQFKYDPNDETKLTDPITVSGNTRTTQTIPLEITVPSLAPVFTSNTSANVEINSISFYYDNLGVF